MSDQEEAAARAALCLLLALALSACAKPSHDAFLEGAQESSPITYETIGMIAGNPNNPAQYMAREALADGFLSQSEYNAIIEWQEERRKQEVIEQFRTDRRGT